MKEPAPTCELRDHTHVGTLLPSEALERAALILKAMGDSSRLRILDLLKRGELCVTEIVAAVGEKFSTVSQRLKLLRGEGLIVRRRAGNHIHYALADRHVVDLILNALAHANELNAGPAPTSHEGDD
jgi:ArsR family transcriptional regulator, lead/cadmium/zinc/bismuth-responsive transcriptional repressor